MDALIKFAHDSSRDTTSITKSWRRSCSDSRPLRAGQVRAGQARTAGAPRMLTPCGRAFSRPASRRSGAASYRLCRRLNRRAGQRGHPGDKAALGRFRVEAGEDVAEMVVRRHALPERPETGGETPALCSRVRIRGRVSIQSLNPLSPGLSPDCPAKISPAIDPLLRYG
jgi:hypothetical protein